MNKGEQLLEINKIYQGDCLELMKELPDKSIDLTVTSPPYDNLRTYNGYHFDFENIAKELFRITKKGGVVVWVVGDATINGSETGTSFRQALYFKEIGFNLHDTMIYKKKCVTYPEINRYYPCFEYVFILSINKPKTVNLIRDIQNKWVGQHSGSSYRQPNNEVIKKIPKQIKEFGIRNNIWEYDCGYMKSSKDIISYKHPATFPEKLVEDHIISWSNKNDLVFDPMCGSGTTCKMAIKNNRNYIGFEISQEYCDIANKRIADYTQQLKLEIK